MSTDLPPWLKNTYQKWPTCEFDNRWTLGIEPVWGRTDGVWVGVLCRWDDHQVTGVYASEAEAIERARQDALRWINEDGPD